MLHFSTRMKTNHLQGKEKLNHDNSYLGFFTTGMATEIFVFPGDILDSEALPSHPKLPLKLGPGLRHIPPHTITPTVAGQLCVDKRKNAVWVEYSGSRVCLSYLWWRSWLTSYLVRSYRGGPGNSNHPQIRRRRYLLRQLERLYTSRQLTTTLFRRSKSKNKT